MHGIDQSLGKESAGGLIPASHPIRALYTPFLILEKGLKCMRVLSAFLVYARPGQLKCSPLPLLVFLSISADGTPGKSMRAQASKEEDKNHV